MNEQLPICLHRDFGPRDNEVQLKCKMVFKALPVVSELISPSNAGNKGNKMKILNGFCNLKRVFLIIFDVKQLLLQACNFFSKNINFQNKFFINLSIDVKNGESIEIGNRNRNPKHCRNSRISVPQCGKTKNLLSLKKYFLNLSLQ